MMVSDATPSEPPRSIKIRLNKMVTTEKASTLTISDDPLTQLSKIVRPRHLGRTTYSTCRRLTQNQIAPTTDGTA